MSVPCRTRRAITLVELLIVVAIMGIILGMALPKMDPGVIDQLEAAAHVVLSDTDYARSLAVGNNSTYEIVFETANNRYFIRHTGATAALHDLPATPYLKKEPDVGGKTRLVTDFKQLLGAGPQVSIYSVTGSGPSFTPLTNVEFQPLGNTTRSDVTIIWLQAGEGDLRRRVAVTINSATGLASVGDVFR